MGYEEEHYDFAVDDLLPELRAIKIFVEQAYPLKDIKEMLLDLASKIPD